MRIRRIGVRRPGDPLSEKRRVLQYSIIHSCRHYELLKRTVLDILIKSRTVASNSHGRKISGVKQEQYGGVPVSSYLIKRNRSAYFQRFEFERPIIQAFSTVSHFRRGN